MARIGKLNIEIGASNNTRKGLLLASRDISRWAKDTRKATAHLGGVAFKGVAAGVASVTAAATAAGGAIGYLTMKSIDAVGDANDFAKSIGASYTELRKLQKAAQLSGVDLATTNVALMKMSDVLGSAFGGNKAAIESFDKIGVSVDGLKRMRPEQQFLAIGEAINRIKDPSEKIAAARDIFGRSGGSLISFFQTARADINEAGIALDRFGVSLAQVDVEKIDAAGDAFGEWKFIVEGIGNQLAKQFAPLILDASDRLVKMIDDAGGVGKAVEVAFDYGVDATGSLLDAVESLEVGWMKLGRTITGVGVILKDISSVATMPFTDIYNAAKGDETENRLKAFPEHRREQARKMIEARGGFESEDIDVRKGLIDENADYQKRIAEIENRKATRGSLGDRFVAWEQQAQMKGAVDAAGKLANVSEERLDAEEKITKELKAQKGIAEGGQGKFALMAFNGAGSRPTGGGKGKQEIDHGGTEARRGGESAGAMAVAASSEAEIPFMPAVESQPLSDAMAGPKASGAPAGSYAAWKEQHPSFGTGALTGDAPSYQDWKAGREAARAAAAPGYASKIPGEGNGYESKTPGMRRGYMDKMGAGMEAAVGGDPIAKNLGKTEAQQDKMIALLEKLVGNTKSITVGLA